jgi:hypothetical protein
VAVMFETSRDRIADEPVRSAHKYFHDARPITRLCRYTAIASLHANIRLS